MAFQICAFFLILFKFLTLKLHHFFLILLNRNHCFSTENLLVVLFSLQFSTSAFPGLIGYLSVTPLWYPVSHVSVSFLVPHLHTRPPLYHQKSLFSSRYMKIMSLFCFEVYTPQKVHLRPCVMSAASICPSFFYSQGLLKPCLLWSCPSLSSLNQWLYFLTVQYRWSF